MAIEGIFYYDPKYSLNKIPLRMYCPPPPTLKPMDDTVLLTLSDNISYPTQFPFVPWFPGSFGTKFSAQL